MSWASVTCAERAFASRGRAVAALDLGTNNCRLMIAKRRKNGFAVVATFSRIVRLGEGLAQTGNLSEAAMDRTIEALKECGETIARWDAVALRAVATEACRSAGNGQAFVERVRRETGIKLDVIGPNEEAKLALSSCTSLIESGSGRVVLFDIGGGSTELCLLRTAGRGPARLRHVMSLPLGVVRVAEGYDAPFSPKDHAAVRQEVCTAIRAQDRNGFLQALSAEEDHLIGTSGTATSLAAFAKGLRRYRRREIDGSWLEAQKIEQIAADLRQLGPEGRAGAPSIGSGRADLIMPGCAILQGILDATGLRRLRVADRGLREGVVTELLAERSAVSDRTVATARPVPAE
jgi:exopolyphosphatase/guanosine-5'-triphosphate,3'-diphosphate pyrophosphatase